MSEKYECEKPPCIHVVPDHRRKRFAVFFEDDEGNVLYVESSKVKEAYRKIVELERKHYREASGDEIDQIAREILNVEPVEYVEEEF